MMYSEVTLSNYIYDRFDIFRIQYILHADHGTRNVYQTSPMPHPIAQRLTSQHVHWSSHGNPPVVPVDSTSVPD